MPRKRKVKRGPKPIKPDDRFRQYVDANGPLIEGMNECCHLWLAAHDSFGHPVFGLHSGVAVKAHRYAYERRHKLKLKPHKRVRRICNNKSCVRPEHLTTTKGEE